MHHYAIISMRHTHMLIDIFINPFLDYQFLRMALLATLCISLSASPLGVLLILRRMSLTGDAIAHAILPGVAIAYNIAGLSMIAMTLGGLIAGTITAITTHLLSRFTHIKEDANLAIFYLGSLAFGVVLISTMGSSIDLLHILFGNVLALEKSALILLATISTITLLCMAVFYRLLIISSFDPNFYRTKWGLEKFTTALFMLLVVINLVAGFYALGTLLAVALMILPAVSARFWVKNIQSLLLISVPISMLISYFGLLSSYHFNIPTGPCIVLCGCIIFFISLVFGKNSGLISKFRHQKHFEA